MLSKLDRPLALLTLLLLFCLPSVTYATIGQTADTIEKDRLTFDGASPVTVTTQNQFTVHSFEANGNTIKEFVDNSTGVVFAITWRGLSHPDLTNLLGSQYQAYSAKMQAQPRQQVRKARTITTTNLKVRRAGHMRDWHGVATMTNLLPAGVTEGDLK